MSYSPKTKEVVSVKDLGATGDGVTNDTAAIIAAIATGAKNIYIPEGTYLCANISVPTGVRIFGTGTLKLKAAASLNFDPIFRITGPSVKFEGLTFDGNKASQPADGFSDSWNTGGNNTGKSNRAPIYGDNSGTGFNISDVVVKGCTFNNTWTSGIALRGVSNVLIEGNTFNNCNCECAFLYLNGVVRSTGARIIGNICYNTGTGDATVNANAFVTSSYDGVVCTGNEVYTVERNLIKMEACTRCVVSSNVVDTNTLVGFNIIQCQSGGSDIVISNNTLRNVQRGISVDAHVNNFNITVANNMIDMAATAVPSGAPDGIVILSGPRINIVGNQVYNSSRHGIIVQDTSMVRIANNTVTPNAGMTLSGVGIYVLGFSNQSDIVVSNNIIGQGFTSASGVVSGALAVEYSGFTVTNLQIMGNIVHTLSGLSTERGIRVVVGTFVNAFVTENQTDGIIEVNPGIFVQRNVCGRCSPGVFGGRLIGFGSSAPSSGTNFAGDVQYHSAPAAGGNEGWVCTTGGSPGTWKTFGSIAP
jgi:parallel beta-helix repeat protein